MELADKLRALAARAAHVEHLQTEEATKMALVVPFIAALGYDVYNPLEVIPEYTCDVGIKKGEKVDYAILMSDRPIMLFECKKVGVDLEQAPASQLFRYFHVTSARVGVLTDGLIYRFYSDIENRNKMDERPFLVVDIRQLDDFAIQELRRFAKAAFDIESLLDAAEQLKYTRALKALLRDELQSPSDDFVKFFAAQIYDGRFRQRALDRFRPIVREAFLGFINDRIDRRLQAAMDREDTSEAETLDDEDEAAEEELAEGIVRVDGDLVTTQEEVDGYLVVKAIACQEVEPARIVMRDTKSYCGVLLDDNNRKPICRLRFNAKSKKVLGVFDTEKVEHKFEIDSVDDIYEHRDAILAVVRGYHSSAG